MPLLAFICREETRWTIKYRDESNQKASRCVYSVAQFSMKKSTVTRED